jgi:aspartate/methionine/tyrosine aminotransferase
MTEILLAKPKLPSDWIDLSVGEAYVVREALLSIFDITACDLFDPQRIFDYQDPQGYKPLVQLLEDKYRAPVIITNGAKQGLGAVMFALAQMGKSNLGMHTPYWALIPPLMKAHGLNYSPEDLNGMDSYLCVAPNNPCGHMPDLKSMSEAFKERGIPFIHDAVYYNHIYLPSSVPLQQYGDVQIYSSSKSFGLSGLRVGWLVCPNTEFYKLAQYYMETMTVGVSIVSQIFLYNLLNRMRGYPTLTDNFENCAAEALRRAKEIILQVDPEVLEIPPNLPDLPGMFLFCKEGPRANFEQAKINIARGEHFGAPGFIRMNLANNVLQTQEIVRRLNASKKTG